MFSPVQIGFLHIISTPRMLWCIFTHKDFYIFHFEYKITSRRSFEDSWQTRAPPVLDFFQPIKHLNCFSSKLNLLLLFFSCPCSFPQPSTISSKQLLNVLRKQKWGCREVKMRGDSMEWGRRAVTWYQTWDWPCVRWPWTGHCTSLGFSFLCHKMRIRWGLWTFTR